MYTQAFFLPILITIAILLCGTIIWRIFRKKHKDETEDRIPQAWTKTHDKPEPIYRNPGIYPQHKNPPEFQKLEKKLDALGSTIHPKTVAENLLFFRAELFLTLEYWGIPKYNPIYLDLDRLFRFFHAVKDVYALGVYDKNLPRPNSNLINYAMYRIIVRELAPHESLLMPYNSQINYQVIYLNSFGDRDWKIKTSRELRKEILDTIAAMAPKPEEESNPKLKDITPDFFDKEERGQKDGPLYSEEHRHDL